MYFNSCTNKPKYFTFVLSYLAQDAANYVYLRHCSDSAHTLSFQFNAISFVPKKKKEKEEEERDRSSI